MPHVALQGKAGRGRRWSRCSARWFRAPPPCRGPP